MFIDTRNHTELTNQNMISSKTRENMIDSLCDSIHLLEKRPNFNSTGATGGAYQSRYCKCRLKSVRESIKKNISLDQPELRVQPE